MVRAKLIKSNGDIENIYPCNWSDFSLKELQLYVEGNISILPIGNYLLVVNEEGKLRNLPFNEKATKLIELLYDDYVVGDAIYCEKELIK